MFILNFTKKTSMVIPNIIISIVIVFIALYKLFIKKFDIVKPDVYVSIIALISFVLPQLVFKIAVSWQSLLVFLIGYIAFLLPFSFKSKKIKKPKGYILSSYKINTPLKILFRLYFPVIIIILFFSFQFRISNLLGLPGIVPEIASAGIIFYFLTTGVFTLICCYFIYVKKYNKGFLLLVIMLILYSLYQSLLGWRQGVFDSILIIVILSTFLNFNISKVKKITIGVILLIVVFIIIHLQNIFRGSNKSIIDVWDRLFGIRYLDSIVGFFANKSDFDILFNNFFYFNLVDLNTNTADYHNHIILGGNIDFINGAARTGFGSVFMSFGIIGVFVCFYLLGIYYKKIYEYNIKNISNGFINIFYAINIIILQRILVEQLDYGVLTHYFASLFFVYLIFKIFRIIGLKKIYASNY